MMPASDPLLSPTFNIWQVGRLQPARMLAEPETWLQCWFKQPNDASNMSMHLASG
jgi:hypothetical protein